LADRLSFGHPTAELCYVGMGFKRTNTIKLLQIWVKGVPNIVFL